VELLGIALVEGYSRVKRCTNEGRALLSLDLQDRTPCPFNATCSLYPLTVRAFIQFQRRALGLQSAFIWNSGLRLQRIARTCRTCMALVPIEALRHYCPAFGTRMVDTRRVDGGLLSVQVLSNGLQQLTGAVPVQSRNCVKVSAGRMPIHAASALCFDGVGPWAIQCLVPFAVSVHCVTGLVHSWMCPYCSIAGFLLPTGVPVLGPHPSSKHVNVSAFCLLCLPFTLPAVFHEKLQSGTILGFQQADVQCEFRRVSGARRSTASRRWWR